MEFLFILLILLLLPIYNTNKRDERSDKLPPDFFKDWYDNNK